MLVLNPRLTIVVPHYRPGKLEFLLESLYSVENSIGFNLVVVDDRPQKSPFAWQLKKYPRLVVEASISGSGYAASCNRGARLASTKHLLFLNDDVVVTNGWLDSLFSVCDGDETIGVCVPKVLCGINRIQFDHSAAGGEMDSFGYPFAKGRLFESREVDRGQYDSERDVVWGTGAALLIHRALFLELNGFDEGYFMQMEDVDLCWRLQQRGFRVRYVPKSLVYHLNGWSLPSGSFRKQFLNHRNNLIFLLKNWTLKELAGALPGRGVLEVAAFLYALTHWRRLPQALAIFCAWAATIYNLPRFFVARLRSSPPNRACGVKLYPGSVAIEHYIWGTKTTPELRNA